MVARVLKIDALVMIDGIPRHDESGIDLNKTGPEPRQRADVYVVVVYVRTEYIETVRTVHRTFRRSRLFIIGEYGDGSTAGSQSTASSRSQFGDPVTPQGQGTKPPGFITAAREDNLTYSLDKYKKTLEDSGRITTLSCTE